MLQDFCESFERSNKTMAKMFVKGSIINTKDDNVQDKGALYKPALKLVGKTLGSGTTPSASPVAAAGGGESLLNASSNPAQAKRQEKEKKKSNLELFKEELKRIQTERDEKTKKRTGGAGGGRDDSMAGEAASLHRMEAADRQDTAAVG